MKTSNKGFTLIELLVVIAIIGILAGMVLVSMGGARSKARDAKRQSDMRQLISAQEMYYGAKDVYYSTSTMPTAIVDGATSFLTVPADPGGGAATACGASSTYVYCAVDNTGTPQNFCYYTRLENGITNKGACTTAAPCFYMVATHAGTFYRTSGPTTLAECVTGVQ